MKKICLAGFWIGQYALGVAAIIAFHKNLALLGVLLGVASFFSTVIGGKLIGIAQDLAEKAKDQIPIVVDKLWNIACVLVIVLAMANMARLGDTAGFHFPITTVHVLILFYAAAAFRDVFLIRFYFSQNF